MRTSTARVVPAVHGPDLDAGPRAFGDNSARWIRFLVPSPASGRVRRRTADGLPPPASHRPRACTACVVRPRPPATPSCLESARSLHQQRRTLAAVCEPSPVALQAERMKRDFRARRTGHVVPATSYRPRRTGHVVPGSREPLTPGASWRQCTMPVQPYQCTAQVRARAAARVQAAAWETSAT
jgi:hypothetical protein